MKDRGGETLASWCIIEKGGQGSGVRDRDDNLEGRGGRRLRRTDDRILTKDKGQSCYGMAAAHTIYTCTSLCLHAHHYEVTLRA